MAGLSNFMSNTETKATTLPSWMDAAQQDVVNRATLAANATPQLPNTVAQGAINQLNNPATNPFTNAQTSLNQIATGAANPWIVDPSTGAVSPNTNTALGGLFQAQNQQLQQNIPGITAPVTGAGTASGQFGSLRTQTAADKAIADAQANLFSDQMKSALQNQQTGVQAGTAMGNVGSQYGTSATGLTNVQQNSPFVAASNLGKTISGVGTVPSSVTSSAQISPLNQSVGIGGALQGGVSGLNSLLNTLSPGTTVTSLFKDLFSGGSIKPSGLPMTQEEADANAARVEANLPINPSTGEKMTMQEYDAAINGWSPDPNNPGGYIDDTGAPVVPD